MEEKSKEYQAGYEAGMDAMRNQIVDAWENGKPIYAQGRLWWSKSDRENLRDILSDMDNETREEYDIKTLNPRKNPFTK